MAGKSLIVQEAGGAHSAQDLTTVYSVRGLTCRRWSWWDSLVGPPWPTRSSGSLCRIQASQGTGWCHWGRSGDLRRELWGDWGARTREQPRWEGRQRGTGQSATFSHGIDRVTQRFSSVCGFYHLKKIYISRSFSIKSILFIRKEKKYYKKKVKSPWQR